MANNRIGFQFEGTLAVKHHFSAGWDIPDEAVDSIQQLLRDYPETRITVLSFACSRSEVEAVCQEAGLPPANYVSAVDRDRIPELDIFVGSSCLEFTNWLQVLTDLGSFLAMGEVL